MTTSLRRRRSSKTSKAGFVQKPQGRFTERVQAVGPDHFGIVCVDCAKTRSRYLLADFYGKYLLEPTTLTHSRGNFAAAVDRIRQAQAEHDLRDLIVVIERTGEYHRPVQRAFRAAGWEVRLMHPYATKQYRQPADPGNKTDDTDLSAIFRGAVNGFGLLETPWPDAYQQLQALRRHRRDLVRKTSRLRCQIREVLHAMMPGYAELFGHLWEHASALFVARHTGSAEAVQKLGFDGLADLVRKAKLPCRPKVIEQILAWAHNAPPGHSQPACLGSILADLDDDRLEKTKKIQALEPALAQLVVRSPYVLLLVIPGINIVSTADLAGELGPMENYANPNAITGRAALMPCRYQSDQVDYHGPLRRSGNRRLRGALMQIAENLAKKNHHFNARAAAWSKEGKDPRWIRVKIAKNFSRLAFAMVAGKQVISHPCCRERHYILTKLMEFYTSHGSRPRTMREDLEAAVQQLPAKTRREESKPLQERLEELENTRGPQPLKKIIPLVLAKLGLCQVQSTAEGEDPG
jgi:transposase